MTTAAPTSPARDELVDHAPPDLSYVDHPDRLTRGNAVSALHDGDETFPAMLAAIRGARRSVCLETYIIESDETGNQFRDAMIAAANAGAKVRFIFDAIGSFSLSDEFHRLLREAGVESIEFHPVAPWRERWNLSRRDHRKILTVDDEVGFIGGTNLSNDYASKRAGGAGWRDVHCEIRGPAVRDLARLFRRVWVREGGGSYALSSELKETTGGGCMVEIVDNRELKKRWAIRRAYTKAINSAKESIRISNAYFLPDRGVRRALEKAVERGVKVQVIIPANSDVTAIELAGEYMYGRLIRKGIEILSWLPTMMHAKTAVIDHQWSTIGSYNLDSRSLLYNLEAVAVILDRAIGRAMHERFALDAAQCEPMTIQRYAKRGWFRRILGWVFYQFRKWL